MSAFLNLKPKHEHRQLHHHLWNLFLKLLLSLKINVLCFSLVKQSFIIGICSSWQPLSVDSHHRKSGSITLIISRWYDCVFRKPQAILTEIIPINEIVHQFTPHKVNVQINCVYTHQLQIIENMVLKTESSQQLQETWNKSNKICERSQQLWHRG